MKKAVYFLSILLAITFYFIFDLSFEMNQKKQNFESEIQTDYIIASAGSNSHSPILIIKKD